MVHKKASMPSRQFWRGQARKAARCESGETRYDVTRMAKMVGEMWEIALHAWRLTKSWKQSEIHWRMLGLENLIAAPFVGLQPDVTAEQVRASVRFRW